MRLALEDAGAAYTDVARIQGDEVMTAFLQGEQVGAQPFAPPFLKAGDVVVAQVAAILHFIGPQLQLVPDSEPQRLQALQLQLTIADLVAEVHDTHHPIATGLYYEDQQAEAAKRAQDLRENRLPKFLGYFEQVLQQAGGTHVLGTHSYVDLSLFQLVSGLEYMFPRRMATLAKNLPGLKALQRHDGATAARCGLSGVRTTRVLQYQRHLPPLPGAGCGIGSGSEGAAAGRNRLAPHEGAARHAVLIAASDHATTPPDPERRVQRYVVYVRTHPGAKAAGRLTCGVRSPGVGSQRPQRPCSKAVRIRCSCALTAAACVGPRRSSAFCPTDSDSSDGSTKR